MPAWGTWTWRTQIWRARAWSTQTWRRRLVGAGFAACLSMAVPWWGEAVAQPSLAPANEAPVRQWAPAVAPMAAPTVALRLAQAAPAPSSGVGMLPPGGIGAPPATGSARSLAPAQTIAPFAAAPPPPPASAPLSGPQPGGGSGQVSLSLVARYGRDVPAPINGGLVWRVYPTRPDTTGTFKVLKEDRSASPVITLPPGDYVVHVSFGLASAAKSIHLREATRETRETFELPAGGIKLEGRVGDVKIPNGTAAWNQISFDIYKGSQFEPGEKTPLVQGVATGDLVVVPEGPYHIVSYYGDTNAVVRSDIRVQTGKLTDVTVNHRAALIILKLVSERGGEALANTSWSVITPGGDVIKESIGAFPRVILAEGDYHAIARNEGRTYERDFKVIAGVDGEVEVLSR
jgi:hypothetical protein